MILICLIFKVPLHSVVCHNANDVSWKVDQNQIDLIHAMIINGADITVKDRKGDNIIMIIIRYHDQDNAFNLIKVLTEASNWNLHRLLNDSREAFDTCNGLAVIHILVEKKFFDIIKYLKENAGLKLNIPVRLCFKGQNFFPLS